MKVSLISLLALASSSSTWAKDSVSTGLNRNRRLHPDSVHSQSASTKSGKSAGCDTTAPSHSAKRAIVFGNSGKILTKLYGTYLAGEDDYVIPVDSNGHNALNVHFTDVGCLLDQTKHDLENTGYFRAVQVAEALNDYYDGVCIDPFVEMWSLFSQGVRYGIGPGGEITSSVTPLWSGVCDNSYPTYALAKTFILGMLGENLAMSYGDPMEFENGMRECRIEAQSHGYSSLLKFFSTATAGFLDATKHDRDEDGKFDKSEIALAAGDYFGDDCFVDLIPLIGSTMGPSQQIFF